MQDFHFETRKAYIERSNDFNAISKLHHTKKSITTNNLANIKKNTILMNNGINANKHVTMPNNNIGRLNKNI